jgi:hypothetical protein
MYIKTLAYKDFKSFIVSQKLTQRYSNTQTSHFCVPPSPQKYQKDERSPAGYKFPSQNHTDFPGIRL